MGVPARSDPDAVSALDLMWGLVLEDGRRWGEAAIDHQKADAEAVNDLAGERLHFITRPRGGSKPLALDTPLPSVSGWTSMGDVRVGDRLFDERGCPTTVTGVGDVRLGDDCWRVVFDDGSSIVASGDHEWVAEDRRARVVSVHDLPGGVAGLGTVTTDTIRRSLAYGDGGDCSWSVPVAAPFDLPDVDLPVAPYVLGAWLGAGNSDSSRVTVGDVDLPELRAVFESHGMPFGWSARRPGARCATWRFGNPIGERSNGRGPAFYDSQRALSRLGVLRNKHIPAGYLRASEKQRLELLRGLMDTDGHQSHSISYFNTTSARLAADVAELVVSLGWKAFPVEHRAVLDGRDCGPAYRVGFRSDVCPFHLSRKTGKWTPRGRQASRHTSRMIVAVEPHPPVALRCIRVDSPSHLYLAGRSAVPTHNTTDLAAVALSWLAVDAPVRARGYVVASNGEQAGILIDAAASLVARTPELDGVLTLENEKIIAPNGAWVRILNLSDSGAWGLRDAHLLILDEFAQWPETRGAKRVYTAVRSTVQKVPNCRLVILTSAGEPSHWSFNDVYRPASEPGSGWRLSAMPGPVPWQSPDEIERLRRELRPSEFDRLVLNVWSEDEDRAVSPEDYETAARKPIASFPAPVGLTGGAWRLHHARPNVAYVITVDIGTKNDATVMCVAHKEPIDERDPRGPQRAVVDHLERWRGSRKRPVQLADVEGRLMGLAAEFNRAEIYGDPDQFLGTLQSLSRRGLRAKEWPFTASSVGHVATALVQAFRNGQVEIPDNDALRDELLRVRLRESSPGVTRLDHDRSGHDDQAVTIGMACHLLLGSEWSHTHAFMSMMRKQIKARSDSSQDASQVEVSKALRSVLGRRGGAERLRERQMRSCAHRWRRTDAGAVCAFGCGAVKEPT